MEIPTYKLKWLEKQLKQYNEQEQQFFEDYGLISAVMLDRYLQSRPDLANEPMVIFLKQYASDTVRSYGDNAPLLFDAITHDMQDCMACAAWCIDLLQAYDKWKEK